MLVRMNPPLDPIEPENEETTNLAAKVGFLGTVIVTIGYIIETIGEGIALSELAQEEKNIEQKKQVNQQQLSDIQSKLDYLIKEIDTMKKKDDHFRRW
jgi:hypothetical protein